MPDKSSPLIKLLDWLGLDHSELRGNELTCLCPFCTKYSHLHLNVEKLVYHCKFCDEAGQINQVIDKLLQENFAPIDHESLSALAETRRLPAEAFDGLGIVFDDGIYGIPIREREGQLANLRQYRIGRKLLNAPGLSIGLFGAHQLSLETRKSEPAYLCEGEWDAIALDYHIRQFDEQGIVLGVPGANVFKRRWASWFRGRDVYVFYDNDDPGAKGELRIWRELRSISKSLNFLRWPEGTPNKFDISDFLGDQK